MSKKTEREVTVNGAITETTNGEVLGGAVTLTSPVATECKTIMIELPVESLPSHYNRPKHINMQLEGTIYAEALGILLQTLNTRHVQLSGGRHIDNAADAVRYLLERMHVCYTAAGVTDESRAANQNQEITS